MDSLGIDIQVLHSTMWLLNMTSDPDAEAALTRSWNRWLGATWKESDNRLRWSCILPTLLPDEAVVQMRWAKEHGAVALFLRSMDGERWLTDPFFYPVLAAAERLDMSIAVHIANANPVSVDMYERRTVGHQAQAWGTFRVPTVSACMFLILSEIPSLFPNLRWGFIESAAQWMPWVHNEALRRYDTAGRPRPDNVFEAANIFVTCQTDDDLPWVLKYAGENCLLIGTDYGHADPSSDIDAISILRQRDDISDDTKEGILSRNPSTLYGLAA